MIRGLLALDIDGVLTDGTVSINAAGEERKRLSYRDIDAVFRARREGLVVALLTAEDTPVAARIAERLEVEHFLAGRRDKGQALRELVKDLGLAMEQVCYIGDSAKDREALQLAGLGLVPADAEAAALDVADRVLAHGGGQGAVMKGLLLFLKRLENEDEEANGPQEPGVGSEQGRPALAVRELIVVLEDFERTCLPDVVAAGDLLKETLERGGTVYCFGDGGSAGDAQRFAADVVGSFGDGPGIGRAVALTVLGNDTGFSDVYSRQLELLSRPGDVAVVLTTSGTAESVRRGLETARELGLATILIAGGEVLPGLPANVRIVVPSSDIQRIREVHRLVVHTLCAMLRGGR